MSEFTPVAGLLGGALIGMSAVVLLACTGRLAGISNFAHGLVVALRRAQLADAAWRAVFLLGMVAATWAYFHFSGAPVNPRQHYPSALLVLGGLLVGYGTSMGNGCTSGHGVCGLGRLSVRSLVATLTFMTSGGITVYVLRHVASI